MEYFLVDVKTVQVVDGKDVALDYINTYTNFSMAMIEAMRLATSSNVCDISVHKWILKSDGTATHSDECWTKSDLDFTERGYFDLDTLISKGREAQDILTKNISDDLKLYEIFKVYSDYLRVTNTSLYYALLGWKDSHLKELTTKKAHIVKAEYEPTIYRCACDNCNGTGLVQAIPSSARGITKCPICNGVGEVINVK